MSKNTLKLKTKNLNLNQQGFSLIELLVVVVIIGTIAAIAVPNLIASRRAANESAAIANTRTIFNAQLAHYSVHNAYATKLGRLAVTQFIDNRFGKTINDDNLTIGGYRYHISGLPTGTMALAPAANNIATGYILHVHPAKPKTNPLRPGSRGFYVDSDKATIYVDEGDDPTSFGGIGSDLFPLKQ